MRPGRSLGIQIATTAASTSLGRDAWFYDPSLDQTFSLNLSTTSSGFAFSTVRYLSEDGIARRHLLALRLARQLCRRSSLLLLHRRRPARLGSLVEGGLPTNGWDYLATAIRTNGLGHILGNGKLTSQTDGAMAYLLIPVPEPSGLALLAASGCFLLTAMRRYAARVPSNKSSALIALEEWFWAENGPYLSKDRKYRPL